MSDKNRGIFYERTQHNPLEKAFADAWEKENEPKPYINYGNGILQDLFMEPHPQADWAKALATCKHLLTDDERYVAATVVQWLGTNCGFAFLQEVLEKDGWRITKEKR